MEEPLRRMKPSATHPNGWLILDRFVHRSRRWPDGEDATASASSHDCTGRPIRASFTVADPPAMSRLHLHWSGTQGNIEDMEEPTVIAAHHHSILFKVSVPFKDPDWNDPFLFPINYFVYSVSSCSSPPPSLTRLAPCFLGVAGNPKEDKYFKPYHRQRQRVMRDLEMNLLCHGEEDGGEFTVADLSPHSYHDVELCMLRHHAPPGTAGAAMQWMVKLLQVTPDMRMMGLDLCTFRTDVVLPVNGHFLCWVDYYQGMLLVDVLHTDPDDVQQFSFIPLPDEALRSRRRDTDAGDPDPARCVCVTDAGIVRLVCIVASNGSPSAFTIKTWTLAAGICRGQWEKDIGTTMDAGEFFGLYGDAAESGLPRVPPSFPLVSFADPDVICFLLKEEGHHIFWMVEVDVRNKMLQSSALYMNEEEARMNSFEGHYFNPSKFMSKDAQQHK